MFVFYFNTVPMYLCIVFPYEKCNKKIIILIELIGLLIGFSINRIISINRF